MMSSLISTFQSRLSLQRVLDELRSLPFSIS